MNVGVIGGGTMGSALAVRLARAGHEVHVGTRSATTPWPLAAIPRVTYQQALEGRDLTIIALPWPISVDVLRALAVPRGRVLVDVGNPETPDGRALAVGHDTSGAEVLAAAVPGARVVKAFSHYYAELLREDVAFDGGPASVLYCGDDADAKAGVHALITSCALDPVDAGPLAIARFLEPMAMLTVALVRAQGWGPTGVAWRLMRRREVAS
ncbi:MAG: NAD(P)-binding domain-containing protein [Gemmatimonadetes bacterium]|nr:NAD(P)-binding domain-containing protein [Gemmatimonadota bacterium]